MDLWFTTSVGASTDVILATGAGVSACVLNMFCFGYSTDGMSLNVMSAPKRK